ncbi:MAG TPA: glycosyltransferase family 4 protein, partial [Chthoniobacteraceae bacterium]|nr:glycosyltransferase family 4 protein [Chthoniobacteraceae bacterium]
PAGLVTAFNSFGLEYARRRVRARNPTESTEVYLWGGKRFCELIIRAGLGSAGGVYAFNSAGLELLKHARGLGLKTVMEQTIAPTQVELRILSRETAAHPDWEPTAGSNDLAGELAARESEEWKNADVILCGSEFVKQGIAECGGPLDRCKVVPYGVAGEAPAARQSAAGGPLRVLAVGAVGLRKGAPYIFEAARALGGKAKFRMAGNVALTGGARAKLSAHAELLGAVQRSEISKLYAEADVFLLPSLCEGSATATYEALAAGLPVITTPNAGSVVRDGVDGFIVPVSNAEAIAEKLGLLASDRTLLNKMSANARERSLEFTLQAYSRRLLEAVGE